MKKLLLTALMFLSLIQGFALADSKLSELTTNSSPASTDLLYDVAGGTSYKITAGALGNVIGSSGATYVVCSSTAATTWHCDYTASGSSDQTPINSALTAAGSVNGVVKLTEGTYNISGTIKVPSNVIFDMGSATINLANSSNVSMIENSNFSGGNSNFTIRGGFLNGNGSNQSTSTVSYTTGVHGIWIDNASNFTLENTYVSESAQYNYRIQQDSNCAIRNIKVYSAAPLVNSDGLDFIDSHNCTLNGFTGTSEDDFLAFDAEQANDYNISASTISATGGAADLRIYTNYQNSNTNVSNYDISVSNASFNPVAGRFIISLASKRTDSSNLGAYDISISNITGIISSSPHAISFSDASPTAGASDISFSNVSIYSTDGTGTPISNAFGSTYTLSDVNFYNFSASPVATIGTSGNVGIGTSVAGQQLMVYNSSGQSFMELGDLGENINPLLYVGADGNNSRALIETRDNYPVDINSNNTQAMRIDTAQNVGIGTITTTAKLTVSGGITDTGAIQTATVATTGDVGIGTTVPGSRTLEIVTNAATQDGIRLMNTASGGRIYDILAQAATGSVGVDGLTIYDATASAARMFLDQNGNVGIGTVAPTAKLAFASATGDKIHMYENGNPTGQWGTGIQSGEWQFYVPATNHMSFNGGGQLNSSGTNEVMRINASGNVGIGTTVDNTGAIQIDKATNSSGVGDALGLCSSGSGYCIGYCTSGTYPTCAGCTCLAH